MKEAINYTPNDYNDYIEVDSISFIRCPREFVPGFDEEEYILIAARIRNVAGLNLVSPDSLSSSDIPGYCYQLVGVFDILDDMSPEQRCYKFIQNYPNHIALFSGSILMIYNPNFKCIKEELRSDIANVMADSPRREDNLSN